MKLSTESYRKSLDIDDFVAESKLIIQDYKCPLCTGIYLNPVVDLCGHVYCKTCIIKYMGQEKTCPISGWKLEEGNMSTLVIVNEILEKQLVLCKNRNLNCNWSGKLSELESHINSSCPKHILKCPNVLCPLEIIREEMNEHFLKCNFRIVECQDCLLKLSYTEIETHQNDCPNYKVPCPQECEELIKRKDVELHIALNCINSLIECPYKDYGCQNKITKKELNGYLTDNMNKHSLLLLLWVKEFQRNMLDNTASLKDMFSNLESKVLKLEEILSKMENKLEIVTRERQNDSPLSEKVLKNNNHNCYPHSLPAHNGDKDPTSNISTKYTNKKRNRGEESNKINKIDLMELSDDEKEKKLIKENTPISPLYSIRTSSSDGIKKKEHIFDNINISRGIEVLNTRATCIPQAKNEHRFVFANMILNDKETEWRIIVNNASAWIALGMCIKDQVIANKYRFVSNSSNFNHSFFGFSINGYLWNANNQTENNFFILNFPLIAKGDIIMFKYFPEQRELYYKTLNKLSGRLTNVYAPKGGFLTPCIIFLNPGDEVLLETI